MTFGDFTNRSNLLASMGSLTSDAEADAMAAILKERGIHSSADLTDEQFFALIPEAIERAAKGAN